MGNFEFAKAIGANRSDAAGIKLRAEIMFLRPDQIDPDPEQPREEFDEVGLAGLAESLRKFSQLQPVLVRKHGARYILVTGERRWRAAKLAKMPTIQCLLCKGGDTKSLQLVENIFREDLKPIEEAKAFQAIMKREGWGLREMAKHLHLEPSRVSKSLRLLKLSPTVQKSVDKGVIPPTTAYEIARRPKSEQRQLAKDVAEGKVKGTDLRRKPTPAPAPPQPTLLFGKKPDVLHDWDYDFGNIKVNVTGFRNKKEMLIALERALAAARAARLPLAGGL